MKSDPMIATNGKSLIIVLCIVLAVITSTVYMQVGEHQFLNFDDTTYVTENSHVEGGLTGRNVLWAFTSIEAANWHPVTWLSHMADVQLIGMNPRGHHLTNVAIHIVSTLSLFLLFVRLTGGLWQSAFVAAMFALHPLHVESVAWVAERKDVLSAFFWFLTLLLYAEYVATRKTSLYLLALFSFVLGLMSKPMLVTLPLVMLLIDFWPFGRLEHKAGQGLQLSGTVMILVKEKVPFFACSLLSAAMTIYAQHTGGGTRSFHEISLDIRIENALVSYVTYVAKMFWPRDLAIFYPFPPSFPLWQTVFSLLVLSLVSAAVVWTRRRHPHLVVGWFWFLVTLLPVIGLIQVGDQSMADRYTYLPLTGLFIMVAWGMPSLAKKLPHRQGILALFASVAIIASAVVTWQQLGHWRNNTSVFRRAVQATSGNYLAHFNLGAALAHKGEFDAAIAEYRAAVVLRPDDIKARSNLGTILAQQGDFDAAIKEYRHVIAIAPFDIMAHNNLGNALSQKGELHAAIIHYQKAIRINPNDMSAYFNLGTVLAKNGFLDAAISTYRQALAIHPDDSNIHINLGTVYYKKGDLDAAISEYRTVLSINPDRVDAYNNLGIVLDKKRNNKKRQ